LFGNQRELMLIPTTLRRWPKMMSKHDLNKATEDELMGIPTFSVGRVR